MAHWSRSMLHCRRQQSIPTPPFGIRIIASAHERYSGHWALGRRRRQSAKIRHPSQRRSASTLRLELTFARIGHMALAAPLLPVIRVLSTRRRTTPGRGPRAADALAAEGADRGKRFSQGAWGVATAALSQALISGAPRNYVTVDRAPGCDFRVLLSEPFRGMLRIENNSHGR